MANHPPRHAPRTVLPGAARRVLPAATLLIWAWAAPATAQEATERRAAASVEGSLALTRLHGSSTWMSGVTGLLGLGPRFSLGGSGSLALEPRRVAGSVPGTDLDLRVAYGGVVGQLLVLESGSGQGWLRILAGAGNAKLDLAAAQTQIASDNFGVVVGELGGDVRLHGRLRAGAAAGYRFTYGVEDLPGVGALHLRGPTMRVLLSFHHP